MTMTDTAPAPIVIKQHVDPELNRVSQELIPATPALPAINSLTQVAAQGLPARQGLDCYAMLDPATQARADKDAADLLPKMLASTELMMSFAISDLEDVNALVERVFRERRRLDVPEAQALISDLDSDVKSLVNKYDVRDPKVLERFEQAKLSFLDKWRGFKSFTDMIVSEIEPNHKKMGHVKVALNDKINIMKDNVTYYDTMSRLIEQEIAKLVYSIAVMQRISVKAREMSLAIPDGEASLGNRADHQRYAVDLFATNMDAKIMMFKTRLFDSLEEAPKILQYRELSVSVANSLFSMVYIVIPTMMRNLMDWATLSDTFQAANLSRTVAGSYNRVKVASAAASAEMVPVIAEAAFAPPITVETIAAVGMYFGQQTEGYTNAIKQATATQRAVDAQMAETLNGMQAAVTKMREEIHSHTADQVQPGLVAGATGFAPISE